MAKIDQPIKWVNRIIGHEEVAPDQLMAHPDNWRIHPAYQQEALRGVINDIGYIKSVTVNKRTGRVVDGHLRVTLAMRDHIPLIPVEYVDLTEEEEAEALLTIDPIAALAGADKDNLQTLMDMVKTDDAAVAEQLKQTAMKAGSFLSGFDSGTDDSEEENKNSDNPYALTIPCSKEERDRAIGILNSVKREKCFSTSTEAFLFILENYANP